jgi:hypothetical protein
MSELDHGFFQFCGVGKLEITPKRSSPNLSYTPYMMIEKCKNPCVGSALNNEDKNKFNSELLRNY